MEAFLPTSLNGCQKTRFNQQARKKIQAQKQKSIKNFRVNQSSTQQPVELTPVKKDPTNALDLIRQLQQEDQP